MEKKFLTNESRVKYTESLKTTLPAFTPRQRVFFMPMAWTRAENNQYQPKHCNVAFSESAPLSYLVAFLRKTLQMKKLSETTLQTLYRYYSEMKSTWYKGKYSIEQEEAYGAVFFALHDALVKLPCQTPADKKIKLKFLKNLISFPLENEKGEIDTSRQEGFELEALDLCDQLAAE